MILSLITTLVTPLISSLSIYNAQAQALDSSNNGNNTPHISNSNNNSTSSSPLLQLPLPELFTKVKQSVLEIQASNTTENTDKTETALGSGFVYDKNGHIITSYSVVNDTKSFNVKFWNGSIYPANIIGSDRFTDLAVLQLQNVSGDKLVPLAFANSSKLKVGEQAITIASQFGISGLLTEGVISGLGILMPVEKGGTEEEGGSSGGGIGTTTTTNSSSSPPSYSIPDTIVTDVPTNPGSAGGPLLNMRGEVIGMNSAVFSSSGEFAGISFAIPSNTITKVVPSLIATGSYMHPSIGITGIDITPEIAKAMGLQEARGFLVTDVAPQGPAAKAGIQGGNLVSEINGRQIKLGGDVILQIDNKTVRKIEDILTYLENHKTVGDSIKLTVMRDGKIQQINVIVGSRPNL